MLEPISSALSLILKLGGLALILNEVRGAILAAPVLWGLYQSGGTLMALWLGLSSLAGIALSVLVPGLAARMVRKRRAVTC